MDALYLLCAAVGGTLLLVQTLALALFGASADAHADLGAVDAADGDPAATDGDGVLKALSLKGLIAFATFFGLAGLAAEEAELPRAAALAIAVAAGGASLWLVAWLMASLAALQSRGNVDLRQAVGRSARVYLRVPGARQGAGRVTVVLQGRTVECRAVTGGDEIPTGAAVAITGALAADTLEVRPLSPTEVNR